MALQPVRKFVLAQALFHFMETGIHETIHRADVIAISQLAYQCQLDERRLRGFLRYLANEGFVAMLDGDATSLTGKGIEIATFRPWYTLLIGGYAQTFLQLGEVLADGSKYADRNSILVGKGSCGISEFDALPMARRLLARISDSFQTIIDVGCGDGRYLVELCESMPWIRGIGIEASEASVASAREFVRGRSAADRIEIRMNKSATLPDLSDIPGPLCFVTAFVLQEMLEQADREAIVGLLNEGFARHPDSHWIVVEVDHRPADPDIMATELGLSYYNPYYLIHQITQQRLETRAFWETLFSDAGLTIVSVETPDPNYDSLGLKIGYLLAAA